MTVIRLAILIAFVATVTPALAQQNTPTQMALQLNNVISTWAVQLEAQQRDLAAKDDHIKSLNEQIKALREKTEKPDAKQQP